MPRVRASVRLWQTELFIIVIVVAILVLSSSLTRGLDSTLRHLGEASQLNNAASLASALSPEFPLTVESLQRVKTKVADHSRIYADAVWVYDLDGTLYAHSGGLSISDEALDQARRLGLADSPPFTSMNLKSGGYSIAGKAIYDSTGRRAGSVVVAGSVSTALAVLDAVRSRLWTTFWIALIVAGLLGFVFSEFIGRRVREMSRAATAIAAGDFNQRVPLGMVPDEVRDLAESYNLMAVKLGEAFSEVEQREQEIRAVVTSMAEGVIAFDSAGTVRVINPEAIRLLEDPPVDLVGVPARAITGDLNVLDAVAAGLSGAPVSSTATIGERTVLLHCTPLRSREGEAQGAVLVLGDVTERTRLEEAQRRFISDASHEMRTPIAAIKGLLELLEDGAQEDPETRADFLRTMQLEADRLGRLVADMLTLAQLEAGTFELHLEPASVRQLFGEVTNVLRALAERADVGFKIEADGDLEVMGDRDRIIQVLLGLVDNAIKHSPRGSTITLEAARSDGCVSLGVRDEGSGIDPASIPHLFDRFYRADASRGGARGAGLGLSIAKEIIEGHGSAIAVDSRPGEGSTFSFELPVAG